MEAVHRLATAAGLIGGLLLVVSTADLISAAQPPSRHALQEKYRRPATVPYPKDNHYSEAKFKLGRVLFFDPILSGSGTRSCAT